MDGNFDNCLDIARKLGESYPVFLVNSVNPARIQGQKTGAFEVVDALGDAPDIHVLPVGNAGNITAYWKGYKEYSAPFESATAGTLPAVSTRPRSWGLPGRGRGTVRRRPPDHGARHHRDRHPDRQPRLLGRRHRRPRRVRRRDRGRHGRGNPVRAPLAVRPRRRLRGAGLRRRRRRPAQEARRRRSSVGQDHRHHRHRPRPQGPPVGLRTEDGSEVQPVKVSNDVVTVAAELGLEEK